MRQKIVILPKVYDAGGDISKAWFVYFSVRNPLSKKMERFRKNGDINKQASKKERYKVAQALCDEFALMLKNGWTPFDDDEQVIYEDTLQYRGVADIYSEKRKSNRNIHFFASQFLQNLSGGLSEATVQTYRSKLRTFCSWVDSKGLGGNDIQSIGNGLIKDFFDFIIDSRKLSAISVGKYKQILSTLFEYIIELRYLKINPVYNIKKCNRINDQAARPVYEYDIKRFKKAILVNDKQLWMAIEFEFYCYLRPGTELRLLKIEDIDFGRGLIYINRDNFKKRVENVKEIPNHFLIKLREEYQLIDYPREYYVIGANGLPGPEPLGKNNLRFRFNRVRKALKMPTEYKFYSWKHTGGVLASESGIPEKDISDQMGHTTLKTTSTYLKSKGGRRILSIKNNYPKI